MLLSLVALNLILLGWALFADQWVKDYAMSRVWSLAVIILPLFFIEHLVALGDLRGLGTMGATLGAGAIYLWRDKVRKNLHFELIFLSAFAYAFAWRYLYPDLDGTHSEKLTDFTFILNYWRGERLPPVDSWFPPLHFDIYYALQHYAAGLVGRVTACSAAMAYELSFCSVVALTVVGCYAIARKLCGNRWHVGLLVLTFVIGGTGASAVMHLMKSNVYPFDSMRFIGGSATPQQAVKPVGKLLVGISGIPKEEALELPIETFGYLIQLGDYHPPLSGYLILMGTLLAMLTLETQPNWWLHAAIALSVPLTMAANAWLVPLQLLLVGGWVLYRKWARRTLEELVMISTIATAGLLLAPYLIPFLQGSSGNRMSFRFVPLDAHAPPLLFLILLGPALMVLTAHFVWGDKSSKARAMAYFFLGCLLLSELIYADDIYSGRFIRFNTTLKWWGWTYAGILLFCAGCNLNAASKWCRNVTILALLIPSVYALDLANYLRLVPRPHRGKMEGHATLTEDPAHAAVLEYLKMQLPGIALQRLDKGSYSLSPGLALFAGHRAFLGWPDHEKVWRGDLPIITAREAEVRSFYFHQLADPVKWLTTNRINNVLWLRTEHGLPPGTWEKISADLSGKYVWHEFWRDSEWRIGVWTKKLR